MVKKYSSKQEEAGFPWLRDTVANWLLTVGDFLGMNKKKQGIEMSQEFLRNMLL